MEKDKGLGLTRNRIGFDWIEPLGRDIPELGNSAIETLAESTTLFTLFVRMLALAALWNR